MGRGRQKAKHTKIARQLKYSNSDTDLSELERELSVASDRQADQDTWAEYADKYNVEDKDE